MFSLTQKLSFCNTTSCPKQQRTHFDIAKRIRKLFICYKTVFFAILFERWWPLPKTSANFSAQSKSHFLLFLVFLVPKLKRVSYETSLLILSHYSKFIARGIKGIKGISLRDSCGRRRRLLLSGSQCNVLMSRSHYSLFIFSYSLLCGRRRRLLSPGGFATS